MRRISLTLATSVLLSLLTACGSGGSSDEPAKPVEVGGATSLLVFANSVTLRSSSSSGSARAGVAFADQTGSALGLPVSTVDGTNLEVDSSAPLPQLAMTAQTAVVVALGDNGMPAKYTQLLASAQPRARLACLSTWWKDAARDAAIKAACEAAGGRYVFVGDLYPAEPMAGGLVGLAVQSSIQSEVSNRIGAALR